MARIIKTPRDPIAEAITEFRIAAKLLVATDNFKLTDVEYEKSTKSILERSAAYLALVLKTKTLDLKLADSVLAVTGPITAETIKEAIPKIYQFRQQYVLGGLA